MLTRQGRARRALAGLVYVLATALILPGCGKGKANLLKVEGTVLLGDKVLATDTHTRGWVVLYPDKYRGNNSLEIPRGSIDSQGKFKVLTGMDPGVAPGWYRVAVNAATVIDPKNPYLSASGFLHPQRYIDKDTSELAFEVVENPPPGHYDLKLESK